MAEYIVFCIWRSIHDPTEQGYDYPGVITADSDNEIKGKIKEFEANVGGRDGKKHEVHRIWKIDHEVPI